MSSKAGGLKTTIFLILLTYALLFGNVVKAMEEIPVLTGEWSPYTTSIDDQKSSGTGDGYGLITEIVTAVIQDMNLQPNYQFRPWYEVLDLLRSGSYQYAFPYFKTQSRDKEFLFSEPLFEPRRALFFNILSIPNPSRIKTLEDLKPYTVGFIDGYYQDPELKKIFSQQKVFKTEFLAFKELVDRRIDALPAELIVAERILERYFLGEQNKISRLPNIKRPSIELHLIAPKGNEAAAKFIERFDKSLSKIQASGLHRELISRYQVKTESLFKVRLTGAGNFPLAVGTIEKDPKNKKGFLIPRGTSAIVIECNQVFTKEGEFSVHKDIYEKSRVKILEGPLKDHLLWVPNMFLSFE
jgi:polar amino acid transport system substrate-binding protein